jgi:hypothetical protein
MAFVEYVAVSRRDAPHDCFHRRRLARGVATQQANDLARRNPIIDRFQNMQFPIMSVNSTKLL